MCVASKSKKFFRLKYVYTYAYMCIHVYTNGKRERIYLIWKINREISTEWILYTQHLPCYAKDKGWKDKVLREQSDTTIYLPEWIKSGTLTTSNVGEHVEQEKLSVTVGGNAKPLWKTLGQFITKPNISLPYDPAIVLLGIYLNNLKIYVHTKTCTWIFKAALLITVKTWKQPR